MGKKVPNDPVMLLSFVNMKLRDYYGTFEEFCRDYEIEAQDVLKKLSGIDYEYDSMRNQFV